LPTAPLGDSNMLRPGEWVVATGHPLGVHRGRPPVVRIGRVLGYPDRERTRTITKVVTDAPLISGDSGGPLFDLNGRVVAINVMIGGGRRDGISMHTLINLPKNALDSLKRGETLTAIEGPPAAFVDALRQARGQLARGENAAAIVSLESCRAIDPTDATVRLLEARAYSHARNPGAAVAQLEQACALGYNDLDELNTARDFATLTPPPRFKQLVARLEAWNGVPGERKSDRAVTAAASRLAPEMSRGAVRVLSEEGREVAMGVVMSASGDVLTKASELPAGEVRCILRDGRIVHARKLREDERWDVALLKVEATGLETVDFADGCAVGQWVFTP